MLTYTACFRRLNNGLSIYIHTLCKRAANAMVSLRICADTSEPLLLDNAISNKIFMCWFFIIVKYDDELNILLQNVKFFQKIQSIFFHKIYLTSLFYCKINLYFWSISSKIFVYNKTEK